MSSKEQYSDKTEHISDSDFSSADSAGQSLSVDDKSQTQFQQRWRRSPKGLEVAEVMASRINIPVAIMRELINLWRRENTTLWPTDEWIQAQIRDDFGAIKSRLDNKVV